jgi:hypothetical protein|tara:strand:+ start:13080 stop:13325 length:246 start_codon:yes stop_codon:yes gene_type:complete
MPNRRTRIVVEMNEKIRMGAHSFEFEVVPNGPELRIRAIVYNLNAERNIVGIKDIFESNLKWVQDRMDMWYGQFIKINTGI